MRLVSDPLNSNVSLICMRVNAGSKTEASDVLDCTDKLLCPVDEDVKNSSEIPFDLFLCLQASKCRIVAGFKKVREKALGSPLTSFAST